MNHDQLLSRVVDGILRDAADRQTAIANEVTRRYMVYEDDSIVGYHSYGLSDFVIRLIHDMRYHHGIKWTHTHPTFFINDFACFVNKQGKLKKMAKTAKNIKLKQRPHKLSKIVYTINSKWTDFNERLDKDLPYNKRYFRISLIALYLHAIGKQLPDQSMYPRLTAKVTSGKESFLPAIGRVMGKEALAITMDTAKEVTMRDFTEAKSRFRAR
jgi:hypothetical protein